MASLETAHVYVVMTTLTKPPKEKIVLCLCQSACLFFWFNTKAQAHGVGQLPCCADDHPSLSRDCYLDLSRVTTFLPAEIEAALHRGPISSEFRKKIFDMVEAGIATLAPRFTELAKTNFG